MLTIYLKKDYVAFLNLNKSKFRVLIYYIKTILILYLTNACVLINVFITKINKILFAILCYVYITLMLSLYLANFFLINLSLLTTRVNAIFFYIKIMLSLCLISAIATKTIVTFTINEDKD